MNKINLCALIIVLSSVTGVHHSMFVANFIYYVIHFSKEEGGLVPTLLWRGSQSSLNCLVFSLVREFRSVLKAEAKRGDVRSLLTIPIVWARINKSFVSTRSNTIHPPGFITCFFYFQIDYFIQ